MPDQLGKALEWMEKKRHEVRTVEIKYKTASGYVFTIMATVGRETFTFNDEAGATIIIESRDYLIRAEDFIGKSKQLEPQLGDEITETVAGGACLVQRVFSPGGSEPCWRWAEQNHLTMRVHTLKAN